MYSFERIFRKSDSYLNLVKKNNGRNIPFCLWDNLYPYPNQKRYFIKCINKCRKLTKVDFTYIIDLVNQELEHKKILL